MRLFEIGHFSDGRGRSQVMPTGRSFDQERRRQALRKRLALDFQPLRSTLSKGLNLIVDPEAAVYCTATVEGFCIVLFSAVIKQLSETTMTRAGPPETKITVFHLQVALRSHPELVGLLQRAESARMALRFFLDDATSRALYERKFISSREAKHLHGDLTPSASAREGESSSSGRGRHAQQKTEEEDLIRRHERTRSEWQKREDDPFTDVDFAMVLKCVHPAFTLSYNATMLLSALIRELLNEVCYRADVDALQRRRHPPELLLQDLQGPLVEVFCGVSTGNIDTFEPDSLPDLGELGTQIIRTASECLDRYRLQSRRGQTLALHVRAYQPGSSSALQSLHVLPDVARDTPFTKLLVQMRSKCHLPINDHRGDTRGHGEFIAVYRAHQIEPTATPASLAMPTGAVVYLVARRWWDLTRRTEARRGLLSSQRPQDALVRSLVAGTESKVRKEFRAGTNALSTDENSPLRVRSKRNLANSTSNISLQSAPSTGSPSKSPSRLATTQEEDSLSVLLRERAAARRRRAAKNSSGKDNKDVSATAARQHGKPIKTLNEALVELATLTTGVRGATERLAQLACVEVTDESSNLSEKQLQSLESKWRARLDSTEELTIQTRAAHSLAVQMLSQVRTNPSMDMT
ncbi:hypothetical protein P3T76_015659 [Phytophthora citrophthora]|uniref:Uncharacterized protein n=1 Tax=Phytophthora citrophthora TaxID=4793 RepID=A0AAD9FZC7_9STRA|nr:hypothetical protein P3T76_015659 [Phytophthora citrophthora]